MPCERARFSVERTGPVGGAGIPPSELKALVWIDATGIDGMSRVNFKKMLIGVDVDHKELPRKIDSSELHSAYGFEKSIQFYFEMEWGENHLFA